MYYVENEQSRVAACCDLPGDSFSFCKVFINKTKPRGAALFVQLVAVLQSMLKALAAYSCFLVQPVTVTRSQAAVRAASFQTALTLSACTWVMSLRSPQTIFAPAVLVTNTAAFFCDLNLVPETASLVSCGFVMYSSAILIARFDLPEVGLIEFITQSLRVTSTPA